jgi:hypothetical protein
MEVKDLLVVDGSLGGTVFALHNSYIAVKWTAAYLVDTDNNLFMEDIRAKALNGKDRLLQIFSLYHTHNAPT